MELKPLEKVRCVDCARHRQGKCTLEGHKTSEKACDDFASRVHAFILCGHCANARKHGDDMYCIEDSGVTFANYHCRNGVPNI